MPPNRTQKPNRVLGTSAVRNVPVIRRTQTVRAREQYSQTYDLNCVATQLGLRSDEIRFVSEYLIDLNPTSAATRAGLPAYLGYRLLARKRIAHAVAAYKACRLAETGLDPAEVLLRWADIFRSDINEIVQLQIQCCRYCWGEGNRYQRTPSEMEEDFETHENLHANKKGMGFDTKGGDKYDRTKPPNPDCLECHGLGEKQPLVIFCDTRYMSPGARARIESIETGVNGAVKLKLRPMREIEEMFMRHMGSLPSEAKNRVVDPADMSDDELDTVLEKYAPLADVEFEDMKEVTEVEPTVEPVDKD